MATAMTPPKPLPLVRLRRLPNRGLLRRAMFEIQIDSDTPSKWVSIVTNRPYKILRPIIGWDEASIVEHQASIEWAGGVGPWCHALSGRVERNGPESAQSDI